MNQQKTTSRHGAAVIVTDCAHERFIVQRKDGNYRVAELCGGLSLIGGGIEPGEDARQTLERELGEEIAEPAACAVVTSAAQEWKDFSLQGDCGKIAYDYRLAVFVSELPPADFSSVATELIKPGGMNEGSAEMKGRHELMAACRDKNFIWGIERVISDYLCATESVERNLPGSAVAEPKGSVLRR